MINFIKNKINNWKIKWILKHSGYSSYESYLRYTDPDINLQAATVDNFYHGYPCVAIPKYSYPYSEVIKWCTSNCKSKWRNDWHRVDVVPVFEQPGRIPKVSPYINELFGIDVMFFAFKSVNDYNWFLLKWDTCVYTR
jgi:hypothetical protein